MISSLLLLISAIFFLYAFLRIPRSFTKMIWMPFSLVLLLSLPLCLFGLLSIFGARFSATMTIVLNFACGAFLLLYDKKRSSSLVQKNRAASWATKEDVISLSIVLLLTVAIAIIQFGYPVVLNFETTDPAVHLNDSMQLLDGASIAGQYSTHMICACFIAIVSPFLGSDGMLVSFVVSETVLLFLSGAMFYAVLAAYCSRTGWLVRVLLCFFYLIGYPLNNYIFGFSYWGFSITIICALLFLAKTLPVKSFESSILIAIILFDLMISYSLFVPITYLSVFIWLIVQYRREKLALLSAIKRLCIVFLFPVIAGFLIVFLGIFGSTGAGGVSSAITNVGYSYKNLFSDFVPLAPLGIYGAIVNKKNNPFLVLFSVLFLVFSFALLVLGLLNLVSAYYFSKVYAVVWLVFFVFAAMGIQSLKEKNLAVLASYCAIWALVLFLAVSGIDNKISSSRQEFAPTPTARAYFPLYEFNYRMLPYEEKDSDILELLDEAESHGEAGVDYEFIGSDSLIAWSIPLVDNRKPFYWWNFSDQDVIDYCLGYEYLVMDHGAIAIGSQINGIDHTPMRDEILSYYDPVFSNEAGTIYRKKQAE